MERPFGTDNASCIQIVNSEQPFLYDENNYEIYYSRPLRRTQHSGGNGAELRRVAHGTAGGTALHTLVVDGQRR